MKRIHLSVVTLVLLLLVLAGFAPPLGPGDLCPPSSAPLNVMGHPLWLGMASCTATGCHHSNGPPGARGSEFTTWESLDPHAHAARALKEERSRLMVRRILGDGAALPERQPLCLVCHDGSGAANAPRGSRFTGGEGVGCESCHGAAERWREPHARPAWRSRVAEEKVRLGMEPLWDPGARARLCASCHVGGEHAAISHDWIAAGHPPLFFEAAAQMARLPRHWQLDRDAEGKLLGTDKVWAAGQVEGARAALLVLASQARDPAAPWPEFAQMECASCHHDLVERGRQTIQGRERTSGPFYPGEWYTATLKALLADQPADVAARLQPFSGELCLLERELTRGSPDRHRVAVLAEDLSVRLPSLVVLPRDPATVVSRLARPSRDRPLMWGSAAQRYLALKALFGSLPDAGGEQCHRREASLRRLREALGGPAPDGRWQTYRGGQGYNPDSAFDALDNIALRTAP
jgi:hypothetical protein